MTAGETSVAPKRARQSYFLRLALIALVGLLGYSLWVSGVFRRAPRIGFVTASADKFWDPVIVGAQAAAKDYRAVLIVRKPSKGEGEQSAMISELLKEKVDGLAISPLNAESQAGLLSDVAADTHLVTVDSDCQVFNRLCFVGTDNYGAGRDCGQLIKMAVPQGGRVIISIGSLSKENGQRRRQGLIDELLDRELMPNRPMDPVSGELKGSKYTVLTTLVDEAGAEEAAQLATDAIKAHPDVDCFACLYGYSTPAVLGVLKQTGKLGKIQLVGFDTLDETLDGIDSGNVFGTIVQNQYRYGYESVRILAAAARGEKRAGMPAHPTLSFSCQVLTKSSLEDFRKQQQETP
ncbi:sugar-binding protein [soil metagenome]